MNIIINDECINCGVCVGECPVDAIYQTNSKYEFNGSILESLSDVHYFIATEICDGCSGLSERKCESICPMDAIKDISSL